MYGPLYPDDMGLVLTSTDLVPKVLTQKFKI